MTQPFQSCLQVQKVEQMPIHLTSGSTMTLRQVRQMSTTSRLWTWEKSYWCSLTTTEGAGTDSHLTGIVTK